MQCSRSVCVSPIQKKKYKRKDALSASFGTSRAQFAKGGKGPNQNVTKLDRSSDELMSAELEHLAGLYCMEEQKYVHNPSCYFADDQKTAYSPM